jgi:hypothetical protein
MAKLVIVKKRRFFNLKSHQYGSRDSECGVSRLSSSVSLVDL